MAKGLSQEQLRELREKLQRRFDELRETIRQELLRSDDEHYVQLAGQVHDPGEESVADLLSDVDLAVIHRDVEELREVEQALLRMDARTYGVCEDCGGEIGYARLAVEPTARRCVNCQAVYERTHQSPPPAL